MEHSTLEWTSWLDIIFPFGKFSPVFQIIDNVKIAIIHKLVFCNIYLQSRYNSRFFWKQNFLHLVFVPTDSRHAQKVRAFFKRLAWEASTPLLNIYSKQYNLK